MSTKNLTYLYKTILVEIITKHLSDCKIYLYESDIDVALDNNKTIIQIRTKSQITYDIYHSKIPVSTDVIDLNNPNPG